MPGLPELNNQGLVSDEFAPLSLYVSFLHLVFALQVLGLSSWTARCCSTEGMDEAIKTKSVMITSVLHAPRWICPVCLNSCWRSCGKLPFLLVCSDWHWWVGLFAISFCINVLVVIGLAFLIWIVVEGDAAALAAALAQRCGDDRPPAVQEYGMSAPWLDGIPRISQQHARRTTPRQQKPCRPERWSPMVRRDFTINARLSIWWPVTDRSSQWLGGSGIRPAAFSAWMQRSGRPHPGDSRRPLRRAAGLPARGGQPRADT